MTIQLLYMSRESGKRGTSVLDCQLLQSDSDHYDAQIQGSPGQCLENYSAYSLHIAPHCQPCSLKSPSSLRRSFGLQWNTTSGDSV